LETETRKIELPDGNFLEIEFTPEFMGTIREKLNVDTNSPITDENIREFVYKSFKFSLDNLDNAETIEHTLPTGFQND
tara:strand:+ start:1323 stop:1556 length:234 start_codon:yes stop_codon:yes gene_type:complete